MLFEFGFSDRKLLQARSKRQASHSVPAAICSHRSSTYLPPAICRVRIPRPGYTNPMQPLSLEQILSDEQLRKSEFPVAAEKIFLGHAAVCPLPRRVVDAMTDFALSCAVKDQEDAYAPGRMVETRQLAAPPARRPNPPKSPWSAPPPWLSVTSPPDSPFAAATTCSSTTTIIPPTFIPGWPWPKRAFRSGS
jgi:hypothetical protein